MTRRIQQPSPKSCGQTCIAMLLGVPVADVIAEISDKRGTYARQLCAFLEARGWVTSGRAVALRARSLPPIAMCRVRWGAEKWRAHWVLWIDGLFFDPLAALPLFLRHRGRVLSFVELERPSE